MQLTVKTLKGEKFVVNAEPSNTVAEVKAIIETQKSEFPAANMKLIHSGKVLKDGDTIESCNIKPNAFLVVMITKAKKAATPAPAPAAPAPPQAPKETPAPASAATTSTTPAPTVNESTDTTPPAANTTTATTTTTTTTTSETTPASAPTPATQPASSSTTTSSDSFPPEMVESLTAMGFPEAEVRACLRASQGNPDVAVEYLMNGIPAYAQQIANATNSAPAPASSSGSGGSSSEPLAALRNHPQINQLRQLVQSNPGTLQAVLAQIGQQQPELLQEINSNQELFLQIMNEPVGTASGNSSSAPSSSSAPAPSNNAAGANPAALMQGMNNPAQMAQMIQNMRPEQLQGVAGMMGMSPEQLSQMAQMLGQMPQEDFQNMLNAAMMADGGGDLAGLMGRGAGQGGAPPGAQIVRLTEEEMAAVDRLADMGFDRTEAVQAYLACDKNEALAANLLMDGGWGGDMDMGGNGGGAGGNDGDDNMYD